MTNSLDAVLAAHIYDDPALAELRAHVAAYGDRGAPSAEALSGDPAAVPSAPGGDHLYGARESGAAAPFVFSDRAAVLKRCAVEAGDERLAKAVWCLETVARIQDHYTAAFADMGVGAFYGAWCRLEQAETHTHFLDRHFRDTRGRFAVEYMRRQVAEYQAIYPYALFLSPEIWERVIRCSICRTKITPRVSCGHALGEIYGGEQCHRIIESAEILGLSMVRVPVQKYSALYSPDPGVSGGTPNPDAYPTVRYVRERLTSPWHAWRAEWTTARHPHSRYTDVSPDDPCPCAVPQGTYAACCLQHPGVLRPHLVVDFDVTPPDDLPHVMFS